MRPAAFLIALCLCTPLPLGTRPVAAQEAAPGRQLQVDPVNGNDSHDGLTRPVKTIARGVRLTQPGDTLHLAPGTYHESLDLSLRFGEPGRPITVDGHGAVLDGSEPVHAADWESLGQGLYRKIKIIPGMNPATAGRWYFLWNGKMNHMGRTSKGPSAPFKKPADLQPDEWTYVTEEDTFYLKLAEGRSLEEAGIRYPARSNGVVMAGRGGHLTVKNVTSTHVWNDGFNIHGSQRDIRFENITAIECGDDGFSAHEDAQCQIDGFVSIGNSTGLCDVNESVTHYRNVFIKDCLGHDVFLIGLDHSLENAVVESSARFAVTFDGSRLPEGRTARLRLKNVHVRRSGGVQELRSGDRGRLEAERCTFEGLNVTATAGTSVDFRHCVFTGTPTRPKVMVRAQAAWSGQANVYDIESLQVDTASFTAATFAEFQKRLSSEAGSRWGSAADTPANAGAEASVLAGLRRE